MSDIPKKNNFLQQFIFVIKDLVRKFNEENLPLMGATLAYFFLLSIFPFFIFLNALLGFMNISIGQITGDIAHIAPKEVIVLIEGYLSSVVNVRNTGLLSIGLVAALFSASRAMNTLITVLNKAYDVPETRHFIKVQILSIVFTITMGIAILTMLVLPALGKDIMTRIADFFGIGLHIVNIWVLIRWIIIFAILFITIALLYHFGPSTKGPFKKAIPGTIFTSVAWTLISVGFGIYVNNFGNYSAVYGSLGAVIILMMWFYFTGIIIMLGAELNQTLAEMKENSKTKEEEVPILKTAEEYLDYQFQEIKNKLQNSYEAKEVES